MGFFDISGDVIRQAEAAANFKLVPPPTAKIGTKGTNWTEHGRVVATSSETVEATIEGRAMEILILKAQIEIDKEGSGLNSGMRFWHNMRINRIALQTGGTAVKGSPLRKQHTMSNMSIHKLKSLLKMCGIQPDNEEGYSQTLLAECFPPADSFTGVPSPLVDCAFMFEIQMSESESKNEPGKKYTNYEIAHVIDI